MCVDEEDEIAAGDSGDETSLSEAFGSSVSIGEHAFAKMEMDIDKQRRQNIKSSSMQTISEDPKVMCVSFGDGSFVLLYSDESKLLYQSIDLEQILFWIVFQHLKLVICYAGGRYDRLLRQSRQSNFADLSSLRFLYQSGFNKHGHPVIIFVSKNFPATTVNPDKVQTR